MAMTIAASLFVPPYLVADAVLEASELAEMSLEDLMNLEVTSVSRKAERSADAAAALYVVTQEDIRRSGVRTLADALRLVPGVHVAKINANVWAVGVRGFSGQLDNKLQVLIDGRSVYTPLFAGVFWDMQDTLLEDVERIEVIRGPGGTLWGANAVNGVVNVITKNAKDTQGIYAEAGGGTEERAFGALRYGGSLGDRFFYRFWGKAFDRDDGYVADGDANDDWHAGRLGFRADWLATDADTVMVQGDLLDGETGSLGGAQAIDLPEATLTSASLLGRWTRRYESEAESQFQLYYDYVDRDDPLTSDRRATIDADAQYRRPFRALGLRHEVIWGLAYRIYLDHLSGSPTVNVAPDEREVHLPSGFLQNDTWLLGDRVRVTLGSKVEHTDFTGWELSPSGRVAYLPSERQTLWASVSRAVRITSRLENDLVLEQEPTAEIPLPTLFLGNRDLDAEKLVAYEAGYRIRPADRVFFDLALFYNDYDELVTFAPGSPELAASTGQLVIPVTAGNQMEGQIYGFELAADATLAPWWRVRSSYSHLQIDLDLEPGAEDPFEAEDSSPRHMVAMRSYVDLPWNLELDQILRWIDALPGRGVGSYWGLDLRLGVPLPHGLELSLVGQNLIQSHQREFDGGTQVQRAFYGKLAWRF